jgi:hypothetical protein
VTATNRCSCRPTCASGWLKNHLAWFVLDAVSEMDLDPFFAG